MRRVLAVAALLLAAAPTAFAHEHVQVGDGKYELTIGWRNEPAFVGEPNGLDLKVARVTEEADEGHAHADDVVLGAEQNLTVTYEYGGKTFSPVDFRPAFGRPGWYTAEITPTRAGVYTLHINGTIEGTPVDVRVEPHEVADLDDTSFPERDPLPHEVAEQLADLEARVAKLEADVQAQIENPPAPEDVKPAPAAGLLGAVAVALIVGAVLRRRA